MLDLTTDILDAVDWHVKAGSSGEEFLFSKDGAFSRYIDSHKRPLKLVQQKLGLRLLSHHKLGRHSAASQAATGGESVKAVQAQLGHWSEQSTQQYVHLHQGAITPRGTEADVDVGAWCPWGPGGRGER